jgi:hypothetical protein
MSRFARQRRAGDGNQVRAKGDPRDRTPAAQFRSRDVQRAESARRQINRSVVAGLTGINAYESADSDNAPQTAHAPTGVLR